MVITVFGCVTVFVCVCVYICDALYVFLSVYISVYKTRINLSCANVFLYRCFFCECLPMRVCFIACVYMCLSVCCFILHVHTYIFVSVSVCVCLSLCQSVFGCEHKSVYVNVSLWLFLSVHVSLCVFVHECVHVCVGLCMCFVGFCFCLSVWVHRSVCVWL